MIDLHCHILPGVDDGPRELEESLAIGQLYLEAGFRSIVATPHCIPGTRWMPEGGLIREKVAALAAGLRAAGYLLRVFSGMEIALDPLVPQMLRDGRLLTLADGPYLLLECPFQRLPLGWEALLPAIQGMGYKVLLAHPERCAQLCEKPGLAADIAASGAYVQVDWESLVGLNGRQAQNMALAFAERGYIHCLATDTHDKDRRSPRMLQWGMERAEALLGAETLQRLLVENPRRVLKGEDLEGLERADVIAPQAVRRKWFWF